MTLKVFATQGYGLRVAITTCDAPPIRGGSKATNARRRHGIEIGLDCGFAIAIGTKRRDRHVAIAFLSWVVEYTVLDAICRERRDGDRAPALGDLHTYPIRADVAKKHPNRFETARQREDVAEDALAWEAALEADGELQPAIVERILDIHGDRGARAIDAVTEGRVKAYNDFDVVVGHSDEYIVEGRACTCEDASYNLDPTDPTQLCWHALACRIARALNAVDRHDMWYADVRELL